jgi:hypothetical protein
MISIRRSWYRYRVRAVIRILQMPIVRIFIIIFAILNIQQVWTVHSALSSGRSTQAVASPALPADLPLQYRIPSHSRRVYIAAIHWNNAAILRSHWNDAVVALADALGPENVYVSVHESGSWDDSKAALAELDAALAARGVGRTVRTSFVSHYDEISRPHGDDDEGWIRTSSGRSELRRIPYLSKLRNESIKRLRQLKEEEGIEFDRVLFLNDVVFTTQDVLELLDTNYGRYAAACSMDYKLPPAIYDTFALRDADGNEAIMQTWPYFGARASRRAMMTNTPVPVTSCWNGIGELVDELVKSTYEQRKAS